MQNPDKTHVLREKFYIRRTGMLLEEGLGIPEIAANLHISKSAVRRYIAAIERKKQARIKKVTWMK